MAPRGALVSPPDEYLAPFVLVSVYKFTSILNAVVLSRRLWIRHLHFD